MKGCRIHFLCNGLIFKKTIDIKVMEFSHYIFLLFSLCLFFLLLAPELTYECPHLCIYRDISLSLESKFLFMKFKLELMVMVQRTSSLGNEKGAVGRAPDIWD